MYPMTGSPFLTKKLSADFRTTSPRQQGAEIVRTGHTQPSYILATWYRIMALALTTLGGVGCGLFGSDTRDLVIRVDSISGPSTITPNQALTVRFWGKVGPSGCYHLTEAISGRTPSLFEVRFLGEFRKAMCTLDPILLTHDVELPPPFQSPFTIRVQQPSGPPLEKIVHIE